MYSASHIWTYRNEEGKIEVITPYFGKGFLVFLVVFYSLLIASWVYLDGHKLNNQTTAQVEKKN